MDGNMHAMPQLMHHSNFITRKSIEEFFGQENIITFKIAFISLIKTAIKVWLKPQQSIR